MTRRVVAEAYGGPEVLALQDIKLSAPSGAAGYTGDLTVGDEVIVTGIGDGYADQVLARAADVGHKPESLSFEQAAGATTGRRDGVAPVDQHRGGDG